MAMRPYRLGNRREPKQHPCVDGKLEGVEPHSEAKAGIVAQNAGIVGFRMMETDRESSTDILSSISLTIKQ